MCVLQFTDEEPIHSKLIDEKVIFTWAMIQKWYTSAKHFIAHASKRVSSLHHFAGCFGRVEQFQIRMHSTMYSDYFAKKNLNFFERINYENAILSRVFSWSRNYWRHAVFEAVVNDWCIERFKSFLRKRHSGICQRALKCKRNKTDERRSRQQLLDAYCFLSSLILCSFCFKNGVTSRILALAKYSG